MKKILAIIGVVITTWGGLWLAILGKTTEIPAAQFGYAMGAALLFCAALLFAGWGNSKKDTDGRLD